MKRTAILVAGLMLAMTAQAGSQRIDYAAYAGPEVREVRYVQLYNWQRTGDKQMVVWTKPSTAYLLTLRHNCDALAGRVTVEIGGVDNISGRLQAGNDDVIVGQMRCRIVAIQPLDLKRLKSDRVASR